MSKDRLTIKQERALNLLLIGTPIESVATQLGIGRNTVSRWVNDDEKFRGILKQRRRTLRHQYTDQLRALAESAIASLRAILDDESAPATARVSAAKLVVDRLFSEELEDLGEQLEVVESRLVALERGL